MKCPRTIDVGMAMANYIATIRVTGAERFKVRMWLVTQVVWLGMWVAGCHTRVTVDVEEAG